MWLHSMLYRLILLAASVSCASDPCKLATTFDPVPSLEDLGKCHRIEDPVVFQQELIAYAAINRHDYAAAVQAYDRAFSASSKSDRKAEFAYRLAVLYANMNRIDEALTWATRSRDLAFHDQETLLSLLSLLHSLKRDYDAALAVLEELVRRYPRAQYCDRLR